MIGLPNHDDVGRPDDGRGGENPRQHPVQAVFRQAPERTATALGHESQRRDGGWSGEGEEVDFKVGEMGLSHDKQTNAFYILAFERENPESEAESESPISASFWISLVQARTLAEDALRICAAVRPLCFLCGQPIDPEGHVCPRSNGHTVLETG